MEYGLRTTKTLPARCRAGESGIEFEREVKLEEQFYTVQKEITEDRHAILTVSFDADEINRRVLAMAKDLRKKVRIPGYRPGRASAKAVIRYVGRETILNEMADELAKELLPEILKKEGLEPANRSVVETEMNPFSLVFKVPLEAKAVIKEGYDQVRIEKEEPVVDEEDIQKVLEEAREQNAQWVPYEEPLQPGDMVTMDLLVRADGAELLHQEDWEVVIKEGGVIRPEFVEQVTGMKPGETRTFNLIYPDDAKVPWAGKDATFEVTVHTVKREEFPDIDDEFARSISDKEDLESLKSDIRSQMLKELREQKERDFQKKALDALLEHSEVAYSEDEVDERINLLIAERKSEVVESGWKWETYLKVVGETEEKLKEELRPLAEARVKERAALKALAEVEHIYLSEGELDDHIKELIESSEDSESAEKLYENDVIRSMLKEDMIVSKALKRWLEMVSGEESAEDQAEDTEKAQKQTEEAPEALEAEDAPEE